MSKFGVAVAVLLTVLSGVATAEARERFGLGLLGGVTRVFARGLFPGHRVHHRRVHVRPVRNVPVASKPPAASKNILSATNERTGENQPAIDNLFAAPEARRQLVTAAALALWHGDRNSAAGWWSHGHSGYGWVGPVFWPFAYNDIYGYVIFGDGMGFWDYGYADLYAGIFAPYGSDELAAYLTPSSSGRTERKIPSLQQFCGGAEREIAGLAIGQIQRAIQPTAEQRAALDHLADAANSAAQIIRASCPTQPALTAPARLALMQQRTVAILQAVTSLESPLQELYHLLNDEQKTRLNALANDQLNVASAKGTSGVPARSCEATPPPAMQWPAREIESKLHPTGAQRDALKRLQQASAESAEMLSYECQPTNAITPSDRLAALDRRLDALQKAINLVSLSLEDFYATLTDEQRSQFELIGPERGA